MSRCNCTSTCYCCKEGESGGCSAVAVQVPGYCCKEGNQEDVAL